MARRKQDESGKDPGKAGGRPRSPMPKWMFETRTDRWHEAGLGDQIEKEKSARTWPRLILYALLITAVLVAFANRHSFAQGYGTETRIVTAILLFSFGLGFAAAFGRTVTPVILRRMDPGTAGTIAFVIRLLTIIVVGVVALRIAGVKAGTLAVGGAFTAVVIGLAAQQALGNVFAGAVLQSTRPFRVGQRVKLTAGALGGTYEGTVSSLGLSYTTVLQGAKRVMIPNAMLLAAVVEPLRIPEGVDLRARFDSHVTPAEVQNMLSHAITVPIVETPDIWLEEVDRDEVVLRITVTPARPADGQKLAEEVISVTRGTFEYQRPGAVSDDDEPDGDSQGTDESVQKPDPDIPHGHA